MRIKNQLKEIALAFLDQTRDLVAIKHTADAYFDLLTTQFQLDGQALSNRESVLTPWGRAVSPFEAAHCIKEFMRTKQFIGGLNAAIITLQKKFPGETIRILYAGTGPFAALVLPLTALYTCQEIQLTLMEINPTAMGFLRETFTNFDLMDYVDDFILADASQYKLAQRGVHHILLTETMQNALKNEPQVSIALNLLPQIHPAALMIPKNIAVHLVLMDLRKNFSRKLGHPIGPCYRFLECILAFNIEKIAALHSASISFSKAKEFPCGTVFIPAYSSYHELALLTEIQIYQGYRLTLDECSLNLPLRIKESPLVASTDHCLSFKYIIADLPGFEWEDEITDAETLDY